MSTTNQNPVVTDVYVAQMVRPGDLVIGTLAVACNDRGEPQLHLRLDAEVIAELRERPLIARAELADSLRQLIGEFAKHVGVQL